MASKILLGLSPCGYPYLATLYNKAFDTVCREALLYKIWQLDITRKFFKCIEHMYSNSSAKIKLLNKLFKKIEVLIGTEQGHHMSPELFK